MNIITEVINNTEDLIKSNVITFLNKNYALQENSYILHYTASHLEWYFKNTDFNFVILKTNEGDIIGTISGRVYNMNIHNEVKSNFEINFLCVDFKYRNKKIKNILINKILEIGNSKQCDTGLYISNVLNNVLQSQDDVLQSQDNQDSNQNIKCISKLNYYCYYANPDYLYKLGFIKIPKGIKNITNFLDKKIIQDDNGMYKKFRIEKNENITDYINGRLNTKYLDDFKLSKTLTLNDYSYTKNVITTFTIYPSREGDGLPIGFISYYHLNLQLTEKKKDNKGKEIITNIKRSMVLYYWVDPDSPLSNEELFSNTFVALNTDLILCHDTDLLSDRNFRINLKINNEINSTKYYLFGRDSKEYISSKDIGIFIP